MAEFTITVYSGIHAEIKGGNVSGYNNIPIVLDPLSLSYSGFGAICEYDLVVSSIVGLTDIVLLKNGKNSRFSAIGPGNCQLTLTIQDEYGNSDTDTITITIN
jgi:hypothetical protein